MKNKISYKKITIIVILFLLFIFIINWTTEFQFLNFRDFRLLLILVSSTGILVLLGMKDLRDMEKLLQSMRFNLFIIGTLMSLMLVVNLWTRLDALEINNKELIDCFKPLFYSVLIYIPTINIFENFKYAQVSENEYPDLTRREREVFDLTLSNTESLEILDFSLENDVDSENIKNLNKKNILIEPNGQKRISWLFKVSEDLEKNSIYTFPLVVYLNDGTSFRTEFDSSNNFRFGLRN